MSETFESLSVSDRPILVSEEVLKNHHLSYSYNKYNTSFDERPPQNSIIQVFGTFSAFGFIEPVVSLGVNHCVETLVDID